MATEGKTVKKGTASLLRRAKDIAFEAILAGATLIGLVSLLVLFGYISFDAFRPFAAEPTWYLVYLGTLVTPTAGFTLYMRRNEDVRLVGARTFAVFFGTLAMALVVYVVSDALSPYDVLLYLLAGAVPPLAVSAYERRQEDDLTGPVATVSVVLGVVAVLGLGPAVRRIVALPIGLMSRFAGFAFPLEPFVYAVGAGVPAVAVLFYRSRGADYGAKEVTAAFVGGLVVTEGLYGYLRPVVGFVPEPLAYVGIAALPVASVMWLGIRRRGSEGRARRVAGVVVVGSLLTAGAALALDANASFWVVVFSVFVAPVGYVVLKTVVDDLDGKSGVAGPFLVVGGMLLGAFLIRTYEVVGPDTFLTPALLMRSWNGLEAAEAGVYPQIVGSVIVVGFMGLMAFPVGVGAAIYLEEYAPDSGWRGRLASVLDVNISNLAGVPSVVYGILGLALFRNALGFGTGVVVAASGTLAFLILPIVIVSAQEAIRSVPDSLRQASYGIGASRWQTLREVVLPEAVPGILTGTILALARAIGETAPLVIIAVAATTYTPPRSLFGSATALPLQLYAAHSSSFPEYRHGVVPAIAVVLLVLMITMNAVAVVVRNRYQNER
ncbi:MAG: phosphate ABC transporter permease PstA [Halobacteriales archaeon]|nr:phosphate ABC transporter permease PstA [Halobacteriales archaeon]